MEKLEERQRQAEERRTKKLETVAQALHKTAEVCSIQELESEPARSDKQLVS
jgi:hypothetical protein